MPEGPPPGHFTILYFASASSFTGKGSEFLPAPLEPAKLFDTLEQRYTGIKEKVLSSCLVTINLEYIDVNGESSMAQDKSREEQITPGKSIVIRAGDEVAIIPPVSSG